MDRSDKIIRFILLSYSVMHLLGCLFCGYNLFLNSELLPLWVAGFVANGIAYSLIFHKYENYGANHVP